MLPRRSIRLRGRNYQRGQEFGRGTCGDAESAAARPAENVNWRCVRRRRAGAAQLPRSSTSASANASECVMVSSEDRAPIAANRRAGAAVKLQLRRSAAPYHFDVAPEHLLSVTGAERFHRRFLCREAPGKMDRRVPPALAIGDFAVGEDAAEETVSVTFDCCRDARDIGGIEAKANDVRHSRNHTADARISFRVAADGRRAGARLPRTASDTPRTCSPRITGASGSGRRQVTITRRGNKSRGRST